MKRCRKKTDSDYDHIFFCPPYFELEIYGVNNEIQSTTLYSSYGDWLEGYWRNTLKECHKVLNNGGVFSFTMNNYTDGKNIGDDMLAMAKEYFDYVDEVRIRGKNKNIEFKVDRYETCYELRKK